MPTVRGVVCVGVCIITDNNVLHIYHILLTLLMNIHCRLIKILTITPPARNQSNRLMQMYKTASKTPLSRQSFQEAKQSSPLLSKL